MSNEIANLANLFFNALTIAIIGRALFSWFDPGYRTAVGRILYSVTEPIVGPIRRLVPSLGMFDISPIIALLVIRALATLINRALVS
jgi:YggT family protein